LLTLIFAHKRFAPLILSLPLLFAFLLTLIFAHKSSQKLKSSHLLAPESRTIFWLAALVLGVVMYTESSAAAPVLALAVVL
jgi:predicted neutral ceramidase superfamily lipid hydrolase